MLETKIDQYKIVLDRQDIVEMTASRLEKMIMQIKTTLFEETASMQKSFGDSIIEVDQKSNKLQ